MYSLTLPTPYQPFLSHHHTHTLFLSFHSLRGAVVTLECVEKLIRKDMIDPISGEKLKEKDIIVFQRVRGSINFLFGHFGRAKTEHSNTSDCFVVPFSGRNRLCRVRSGSQGQRGPSCHAGVRSGGRVVSVLTSFVFHLLFLFELWNMWNSFVVFVCSVVYLNAFLLQISLSYVQQFRFF